MARSKQTPRKSTGGKAPRRCLAAKAGNTINQMCDMNEAKKKRRYRPGALALRMIKKYQKTTEPLLRK